MILTGLDIGNTKTLMGVYLSGSASPDHTFSFATDPSASTETLYRTVMINLETAAGSGESPDGFVFSSVVREVNEKWKTVSSEMFSLPAVQVTHLSKLNIKIRYDDPSTLGPDRITNAEAAFVEYGGGVIIDIGTALTICAVDTDGVFRGGIIAPGPGTASRALSSGTSLLPAVPVERTEKVTASSTADAIRSGIYHGWVSMINGLSEKIKAENRIKAGTILTGGSASLFAGDLIHDIQDPMLTMKGLKIIYDENCFPDS